MGKWICDNLTYSQRTANYYMELAQLPADISQRVANSSLRRAIKDYFIRFVYQLSSRKIPY